MPLPQDTEIRRKLAALIAEDARSQAELSRVAGISQPVVSGIVTGARADLRAEVVARLGRALGLSPTALGRLLYDSFPEESVRQAPVVPWEHGPTP